MLIPAGPFPIMCVSYAFIGFTLAIQAAQATGFVASLKRHPNEKMGVLHGTYGASRSEDLASEVILGTRNRH